MKLSVHLVTWNGAKYVPYLFASLRNQTFRDWELVILDNASSDGMAEGIRFQISNFKFQIPVELIEHDANSGFAGGHNWLLRESRIKNKELSTYVLLLNQDMYLMPDCLEKLVGFMDEQSEVAVVSPRLMRWEFDKISHQPSVISHPLDVNAQASIGFTHSIDSMGLKVFRNRRVVECGAGEDFFTQAPEHLSAVALEVFGVSGALPMFRRSAVATVSFSDGTFFDEIYHAYKEDVDLAFRLRSAGFRAFVIPDAVAFHDRSAAGPRTFDDATAAENKQSQSSWARYHSYKNHLATLYKNEYIPNFVFDFFPVCWYELKKFAWFLIHERKPLGGLGELWKNWKSLRRRRKEITTKRSVSWYALRLWWTKKERYEESFGVVPLRETHDGLLVLLIQQRNGDWGFPKGHLERGESPTDTARREFAEETGIQDIVFEEKRNGVIYYSFVDPVGKKDFIHKSVTFFVAIISHSILKPRQGEIREARWCTIQEANTLLTHDESRSVLEKCTQPKS